MARIRVQDSLAYSIYRSARLLRRHFMNAGAREGFDLTQEQWFVLNKLCIKDGRSQVELSEDIFADRPNMTRILATMERRALVRRAPDPDDSRKIRVFITPEGKELEAGFSAWARRQRQHIFAGISDEDLARAQEILGRLEENILRG